MRSLKTSYSATVCLMLRGAAVACSGSGQSSGANVSGVYSISDVRSTSSCSPEQLPRSLRDDSSQYVHLALPVGLPSSLVNVEESRGTLSLTPLDRNRHPIAAALHGTITGTVGVLERAAAPRLEGPREGGYTFYVSERGAGTIRFGSLIGTPRTPGEGAVATGMFAQLVQSDTFSFHVGKVDGAIFTTCVVAGTVAANRT
jgi:hypothetical protein